MRRVSMFICIALFFWLSSCTPDDDGHKIEPTAGESYGTGQLTSEGHRTDQTADESHGTEQVTSESHETETTASESHETGQMANSGHEIEPTITEGYGNYLLVPAGKFIMGDNF